MVIVIERYLRGISGPARSSLLVGMGVCTWGFAIVALALGWKAGVAWLVLGAVAISYGRRRARPAPTQSIEDAETEALSAQERIMSRLATMTSEPDPTGDGDELTPGGTSEMAPGGG